VFKPFEFRSAGGELAVTSMVDFCSSKLYGTGACFVVGVPIGRAGGGLFSREGEESLIFCEGWLIVCEWLIFCEESLIFTRLCFCSSMRYVVDAPVGSDLFFRECEVSMALVFTSQG
jgi:hypothetical protein